MFDSILSIVWVLVFIIYFVLNLSDIKDSRKRQKQKEDWYSEQRDFYEKQYYRLKEQNKLLRAEVFALVYSIDNGLSVDVSAISESEDMEEIEDTCDIIDYLMD